MFGQGRNIMHYPFTTFATLSGRVASERRPCRDGSLAPHVQNFTL